MIKMKREIYSILIKKQPYIYKINNNYYRIGCAVFEQCLEESKIDLYNKINNELDSLEKTGYDIEKRDTINLMQNFEELYTQCKEEYDESKKQNTQNSLLEVLNYCNEDALKNIENQIERLHKLNDFKDNAYYRHSKKRG